MATEFVKTFARVRPSGNSQPVVFAEAKSVLCNDGKTITFDGAYGPQSQQKELYDNIGKKIVEGAIDGISGTIFAYGQTGSGKTFTMMGPSKDGEFLLEGEDRGLVPRCVGATFDKLEEKKQQMGSRFEYNVFCTFVEIYNEVIRDLLADEKQPRTVLIRADQKITLDGASREEVVTEVDALRLLQQGLNARQVGETAMNMQSSRSHAVFILEIETEEKEDGMSSKRQSRICMVDLAGSERQQHSQTTGHQLKEAGNINKSLTVLARVIRQLAEGKEGHVPFRDSRLTLLLRDSLGGNSRTAVVVALHPGQLQERETRSTLQFAECCKKIKNKTVANKIVSGVSTAVLQKRIAQLEEENDQLRREKDKVKEELTASLDRCEELTRQVDDQEMRYVKPTPAKKARRRTTQHEIRVAAQPSVSLWDDDKENGERATEGMEFSEPSKVSIAEVDEQLQETVKEVAHISHNDEKNVLEIPEEIEDQPSIMTNSRKHRTVKVPTTDMKNNTAARRTTRHTVRRSKNIEDDKDSLPKELCQVKRRKKIA